MKPIGSRWIFDSAFLLTVGVFIFAVAGGCGGARTGDVLTAEGQFARAMEMYDRGKFFESAEEFQKVIYNYPGATNVDSAQYFLAMSYMKDKQYELAAVEFERLLKNYPRSEFAVEARFRIAYAYFRAAPKNPGLDQAEVKRSVKLLEEFLIDYPDSPFADEARKALQESASRLARKYYDSAVVYTRIGAWRSAEIYFQYVLDNYAESSFAEPALLGKARALFKQGKWDDAAATANTFLATYPDSKKRKDAENILKEIDKLRGDADSLAGESQESDSLSMSGSGDE